MYSHAVVTALQGMASDYDYCIIDTPGAAGTRATAALMMSGWALVPVQLDMNSLAALPNTIELIRLVKNTVNKSLVLIGLLLSAVTSPVNGLPSTLDETGFYDSLVEKYPNPLFPVIGRRTAIARSHTELCFISDIKQPGRKASNEVLLFLAKFLNKIN